MKQAKHGPINTSHAHHWVIETPQGRTSLGVCQTCGAQRVFKNWLAELDWIQ